MPLVQHVLHELRSLHKWYNALLHDLCAEEYVSAEDECALAVVVECAEPEWESSLLVNFRPSFDNAKSAASRLVPASYNAECVPRYDKALDVASELRRKYNVLESCESWHNAVAYCVLCAVDLVLKCIEQASKSLWVECEHAVIWVDALCACH